MSFWGDVSLHNPSPVLSDNQMAMSPPQSQYNMYAVAQVASSQTIVGSVHTAEFDYGIKFDRIWYKLDMDLTEIGS